MSTTAPWRPMHEAPQAIDRIWLNHCTLGPILAEGRPGRWYAPSAAHQVWRWYRSRDAVALEPFSGWLPFGAFAPEAGTADGAGPPPGSVSRTKDDASLDPAAVRHSVPGASGPPRATP